MESHVVIVLLGPSLRHVIAGPEERTNRRGVSGIRGIFKNSTTATILFLGVILLILGSGLSLRYVLSGGRQDLVYVSVAMVTAGFFCLTLLYFNWRNRQPPYTSNGQGQELEVVQIEEDEPPSYEVAVTPDCTSGSASKNTLEHSDLPPRYSVVVGNGPDLVRGDS